MRRFLTLALLTFSSLTQAAQINVAPKAEDKCVLDEWIPESYFCSTDPDSWGGSALSSEDLISTGFSGINEGAIYYTLSHIMIFEIPELSGEIIDASFSIYLGENGFPDPGSDERLLSLLFNHYVSDAEAMINGERDNFPYGNIYGGFPTIAGADLWFSADDAGSTVSISLGPESINQLAARSGETIALSMLLEWGPYCYEDEDLVEYCDGAGAFDNESLGTASLSMNVVPIPAAVWLFGSALAGLGWLRRRVV